MPPPPHTKPENVLKRAQELIGVNQSQAALALLHEHVTSKRTRNSPIASLEPVMLLFVELCVNLRKEKSAKDGLYSYKNTAQNTNVGTIELVLKKFIDLAEQKVTEAQAEADKVQTSKESREGEDKTTNVEDLEATETPESILLSTVSGEQAKDRTDRVIVTPWLKFLWNTYRTVLEILKNNARLEVLYQTTAHQAFQFCLKYARKTEFRRLCELLRNHLQNAAKYSSQMHAINLSDPDTLQRHLDTRFQQLNVAVELELWQEAFRSVEDIHTLLNLSKRPAKNIMMANYFEKLTRIFLVSENYLFHAAAWSRYYNLMRQSAAAVASGQSPKKDNPAVTEADMAKAASFVLLSALSIPVISTSRSRGALVDVDEARKNKNTRLTNLLGMAQAPTRAILFKDALSKGLLRRARPEIRDLYNILEVDFHPLSICKKISPILTQIGADPEMEKYVMPLQQVILTRLFQQLSQVYESVELKFVMDLAQFPDPFKVTSSTIEKFIMNGCKKGDLAIRVDHGSGVLTFDSDVFSSAKALHPGFGAGSAEAETSSVQRLQSTPAEIVRSQIVRLAKSLFVTCQHVDPTFNEDRLKAKAVAQARAQAGAESEWMDTLARREVIDKKKQAASTAAAQREREEASKRRLRAQQAQEEETQRLAAEQRDREQRRLRSEQERIQRQQIEEQLKELKLGIKGVDIGSLNIDDLDAGRIRALKLAALEKEKNTLSERFAVTGRRIDHIERAFRREEIKHLEEDYAAQKERDLAAYEKAKAETLEEARLKHIEDVALKHRLQRLVAPYEQFRDNVRAQRHAQFEKQRKAAERELQNKMEARRKEFRERKARERMEREEAERKAREEEERLQREAEEKAKAEEAKRRELEERRAAREEERRRDLEKIAQQRQREEQAIARRAAAKGGPAAPRALERPTAPDRADSIERPSAPPRIAVAGAGGKPSWREREAAKAAGATGAADSAAPPAPAAPPSDVPTAETDLPKRNVFVPPALRGRTDGTTPPPRGDALPPPPARGAEPAAEKWRPRREMSGRDGSPADGAAAGSRFSAPRGGDRFGRDGADKLAGRDSNGGDRLARDAAPPTSESPAVGAPDGATAPPPPAAGKPGAYRPGAFSQRRQQQG